MVPKPTRKYGFDAHVFTNKMISAMWKIKLTRYAALLIMADEIPRRLVPFKC